MRVLSLFSGAGGGDLASQHLLGFTAVGYVEFDSYCQKVIAQRIKDGVLGDAPIFGDVRAFISEGYADAYKGMVDVVTAGFPCQPFSVAGQRRGSDDERNMWPQTIGVIRRVRPTYAFLENVPGLLAHQYIGQIFGDLAESGFDARWGVLGASDVGAPHRRLRLWVLAHSISDSKGTAHRSAERISGWEGEDICEGGPLRDDFGDSGEDVAHPDSAGSQGFGRQHESVPSRPAVNPTGNSCQEDRPDWWELEPDIRRVAHGVASRVDRLKALGNGQVSAVAATAWTLLND